MTWDYIDTIPGVSSGGPNPQDAFSMRIRIADLIPALNDSTKFAFAFPDTIGSVSDAVKLALLVADTNPAVSDIFLRLAIAITDSNAAPTDNLSLGVRFSDVVSSVVDTAALALRIEDTNPILSDALMRLAIAITDLNNVPTDSVSYIGNLLQGDNNSSPLDGMSLENLKFTDENNSSPSDARASVSNFWLSGTTGTSGNSTTPANANGPNDGLNARIQTVALGAATATLTSQVGSNIPANVPVGTPFTACNFKFWVQMNGAGTLSIGQLILRSSSALFPDIVVHTTQPGGNLNTLVTPGNFDAFAAGINTLAKARSTTVILTVTDSLAGGGGAQAIDAARLEIPNLI